MRYEPLRGTVPRIHRDRSDSDDSGSGGGGSRVWPTGTQASCWFWSERRRKLGPRGTVPLTATVRNCAISDYTLLHSLYI